MPTAASAMNLVANGSFEDYNVEVGKWKLFRDGSQEQFGWSPTKGSNIEIRSNFVGTASHGTHFAELDNHHYDKEAEEIGIFQDIVTEIGQAYTLSFDYGPREQSRVDGDNLLAASFGDFYSEYDAGNSQDGWQSVTTTITATETLTRLKFIMLGDRDTYGANIDNVKVVAVNEAADVPEPSAMLAVGLVGAFGAAKARRKRTVA